MRPTRWLKLAAIDIRLTLDSARRAGRAGRPRGAAPLAGVERLETRSLLSGGVHAKTVPVPPPEDHGNAAQQSAASYPATTSRSGGGDGHAQVDGGGQGNQGDQAGNRSARAASLSGGGDGSGENGSTNGKALGQAKNGDNGDAQGDGVGGGKQTAALTAADNGGQGTGEAAFGPAPRAAAGPAIEVGPPPAEAAAPASADSAADQSLTMPFAVSGATAADVPEPSAAAGAALGVAAFGRDSSLYGRLDLALRSAGPERLSDPSPSDPHDRLFLEIWDDDQLLFPDAVPHVDDTLFPESRPAALDELPLPEPAPVPVPGSMDDGQVRLDPPAPTGPPTAVVVAPSEPAPVVVPDSSAAVVAASPRPSFAETAAVPTSEYRPRRVYTVGGSAAAFLVALGLQADLARRTVDAGRRAGYRLRRDRIPA